MIDCQTATNVVQPLLAKAGIGTFELIPSYYMEEEKKADGTTGRQIKAAMGARHVKHVSPEGKTSICCSPTSQYRVLDPMSVFGPVLGALNEKYGHNFSEPVVTVQWGKEQKGIRPPQAVTVKVDLQLPLGDAPRRGDAYKVGLVVSDNYTGTGRASCRLVMFRVSCLNLEIFDMSELLSWSVIHKGGTVDLKKLWAEMPSVDSIVSAVRAFYESIRGLDMIMLRKDQFARALHYVLHGEDTTVNLLRSRQQWMDNEPVWDRVTGRCRPHQTDDMPGIVRVPVEPGKQRSGTYEDVFAHRGTVEWTPGAGIECSGKSLTKTVQVLESYLDRFDNMDKTVNTDLPASGAHTAVDGGLSAFGLRQCLTEYLGGISKAYVPPKAQTERVLEVLSVVSERFDSVDDDTIPYPCGAHGGNHLVPSRMNG